MFERYDIEDLYLASIGVTYPNNLMGHNYMTVLADVKGKFIDLQNPSIDINGEKDLDGYSYKIDYIKPLSECYDKGKNKTIRGKRKVLKIAREYYTTMYIESNEESCKKLA